MTPLQHAIKELEKYTGMDYAINILQSLLPVEKEWAESVWDAGHDAGCNHADYTAIDDSQTFEQYYSQFNEVK